MKLKNTILSLLTIVATISIMQMMKGPVRATTTTSICGNVSSYTPATATTRGRLVVDNRDYVIAAGSLIIGGQIIRTGPLCLNATFDENRQIIAPSRVGGSTVSVCGRVDSFRAADETAGGI